ncbi:aldehyde dehydrogenase [Micrococcales bacterium 31B]|nr:aldehyde dehydrogenase [Micrococcales bacterium 31B]
MTAANLTLPGTSYGDAGATELFNPTTGASFTQIGAASAAEVDAAIERAQAAYLAWRDVAPGTKAALLRAFAAQVTEHRDELAALEVLNSGHVLGNALWEADNVANVLNYYAGAPERHAGQQIPVPGGVDITFHEPLGVVGVIVPWNFPMPIAGWGFAPALAAGNAVVLKPAEVTPLTALRLAELALEAGLPEHLLQVVTGRGSVVGQRFVDHPLVRKVCFTGSTEVGQGIMRGCADQIKRLTLELGGKSANIIFDDVDIEAAAAAAPGAVFENSGQDCCARSRILVQQNVYEKFLAALEPAVTKLVVGDPAGAGTDLGPLITARHRDSVTQYIAGADIAYSGSAPGGDGYFVAPSVAMPRGVDDPIWRDEVFGPVVAVMPFADEAEAIRLANDTEFGLSGSIYTRDIGRALRVARGVESGNLSINSHSSVRYWTPFGGFKQSGLGRELGPDALNSFSEVKNVFISTEN